MPTRKREPKIRVLVRVVMACMVAAVLVVPVSLMSAFADTSLGIRIVDSTKTPGAGDGSTVLGIRVTAPTYTITWKANGGNWSGSTADKTTSVAYGAATSAPANPVRTGYTFKGWSTTAGGSATTLPSATTAAATWYAVWAADSYSITYDLQGGTATGNNPTSYTVETASFTLSNPTKTGYTFAGWTGANGTTPQTTVTVPKNSTGVRSYKANWTANSYTVTLDRGAGTGGSDSAKATYGSALPAIQTPSRTGYSFMGYFDAADGGTQYYTPLGESANNWNKTSNATLYARWQANKYAVSFDANGGSGGQTASVDATYDATMPAISATPPERPGYTFAGWYDAKTGGSQYYTAAGGSAANWNKAEATTLYAQWTLQVVCSVPSVALVTVDAAGNVSGQNQTFSSSTVEDIKVTAVKSASLDEASSVFADEATRTGVRVTLTPPAGAGTAVEVPLVTASNGVVTDFTIGSQGTLVVAFGLKLPDGAQLTYAPDVSRNIASLTYVVAAARP